MRGKPNFGDPRCPKGFIIFDCANCQGFGKVTKARSVSATKEMECIVCLGTGRLVKDYSWQYEAGLRPVKYVEFLWMRRSNGNRIVSMKIPFIWDEVK
jgi:hypothetical protein